MNLLTRYNFVLTIVFQNSNQIKGYHDIVAQGGNRIDTAGFEDGGDYSISGRVENNVATVHFKSGYDLYAGGTATLIFIAPDKIEWKIIKDNGGQHYFPDRAILVRR